MDFFFSPFDLDFDGKPSLKTLEYFNGKQFILVADRKPGRINRLIIRFDNGDEVVKRSLGSFDEIVAWLAIEHQVKLPDSADIDHFVYLVHPEEYPGKAGIGEPEEALYLNLRNLMKDWTPEDVLKATHRLIDERRAS